MTLRRWARAFVLFWVDYIVGDDWAVAAVIGLALLATWGLVRAGVPAWWLLPLAVLAATAAGLYRAILRERRREGADGSQRSQPRGVRGDPLRLE
jgi:hypothetical protein